MKKFLTRYALYITLCVEFSVILVNFGLFFGPIILFGEQLNEMFPPPDGGEVVKAYGLVLFVFCLAMELPLVVRLGNKLSKLDVSVRPLELPNFQFLG